MVQMGLMPKPEVKKEIVKREIIKTKIYEDPTKFF
jgi:hypothetical protein